jgi:hypothetical protein
MELNKTNTQNEKTLNPEGSLVNARDPKIQLYLEASNLKIKEDSFYTTADNKLNDFIKLAQQTDNAYLLGLTKFLTDNGLKLSPVVLSCVMANKGFSFRGNNFNNTFNTPQRIAEAVALSKTLKLNNSFKKNILKTALENMSEFTLTKNQLKRRKVKTKDLIKLLRPKPKDENTAKLYKDLIEDKARFKGESFVRAKSSNISDAEKIEYLTKNIDKIPVNELIRNLRFITDNCDFRKDVELQTAVLNRFDKIKNYRFLNVFDLIETAIHVPQLEKMLFETVKRFAEEVKTKYEYNEDATFLFDVSGSMAGEGAKTGFKYLTLLSLVFNDTNLRFFGYGLHPESESQNVISLIKQGKLEQAFGHFNCNDGTALVDSASQLVAIKPEIKNLVIISDEVSWEEGSDLSYHIQELSKRLKDVKVILINPAVYKGTVFNKNVMCFASLTSSVVYNVFLHTKQQAFINMIQNYSKEKDEN